VVSVVAELALVQVSSDYFAFPCEFSFPQMLHTHHLSSGAGTIGSLMADVPSELSLTPPNENKKKHGIYLEGQKPTVRIIRIHAEM
jgi:hypothetical protein